MRDHADFQATFSETIPFPSPCKRTTDQGHICLIFRLVLKKGFRLHKLKTKINLLSVAFILVQVALGLPVFFSFVVQWSTYMQTQTFTHLHTHTYLCMQMHTLTHKHACTCTHMHTHTNTHSFTQKHTLIHTQTHTLSHTHTHTHKQTHTHTCSVFHCNNNYTYGSFFAVTDQSHHGDGLQQKS